MQKKIIHTKPLFEDVKTLVIFQIDKYIIGKFMFNAYKSTSLDIFKSMSVYNSSIHAHDTRQSSYFYVPLIKKVLGKSNVCYKGAVFWNDLIKWNVKTTVSDYVFYKSLTKKLIAGVS